MTEQEFKQEIERLNALVIEKDQDINAIATLIFKTLAGLGVTDFTHLDNVGKTLMSKLPSLGMDLMFPQKMKLRFGHLADAGPLLDKYKHLMPVVNGK